MDATNKWDYPPYKINNDASQQNLGHKTLPTSALHRDPTSGAWTLKEYDVHNLFGSMEAKTTADALEAVRFLFFTNPHHCHHRHHYHCHNSNRRFRSYTLES